MTQYWEESKKDIFEVSYKVQLRDEITPEWDDLVYYIRRHRVYAAQELVKLLPKSKKFRGGEKFRPTGENCLHICAEYNELEMFRWFVEEYAADINHVNDAGETPLMLAAREGKLEMVKLILELGREDKFFKVDQKMQDGWTALAYAAMNGFSDVVIYLSKNGAKVDTYDKSHRSPFHWAARFNNVKMAKVLLELKCKHVTTDVDMKTPEQIA